MSEKFSDNPDYRLYEDLLKRVHALIAKGEGDSNEADELRERMDAPWYRLSEPERIRLNGLSADLYMLHDDEVLQAPVPPTLDVQSLHAQIKEFQAWNDWESVLGLLRRRPTATPREAVAVSRSRAYESLGHSDTAILFLDYAFKNTPSDPSYRAMRLRLLMRARRVEEAVVEADQVVSNSKEISALRITGADVLYQALQTYKALSPPEQYRRILDALRPVLKETPALSKVPVNDFVMGQLVRAGCYFALDEHHSAIAALGLAAQADPNDTWMRQMYRRAEAALDEKTRVLAVEDALSHARYLVRQRDLMTAA